MVRCSDCGCEGCQCFEAGMQETAKEINKKLNELSIQYEDKLYMVLIEFDKWIEKKYLKKSLSSAELIDSVETLPRIMNKLRCRKK